MTTGLVVRQAALWTLSAVVSFVIASAVMCVVVVFGAAWVARQKS